MEPIIILAMPRSGSSMTAGLFAKHGVWVGPYRKGDSRNAKGYYESAPFKQSLVDNCGRLAPDGKLAKPVEGWRNIAELLLDDHGYKGGPWLVKHSAMYYPVWHEFSPQYICVRRDLRAVEQSGKATGYFRNSAAIEPHVEALDYVRDNLGGVDVFTDEIVQGNYSSLQPAFDACGLKMDESIVRDFVDPTLWHY